MPKDVTILDVGRPVTVTATVTDETIYLEPEALQASLGWERKPEGLCRDEICVPVPDGFGLESGLGVDVGKVAQLLKRPFAHNLAERAAYLGVSAQNRAEALASLQAPDFTLPALDGTMHTLSNYRGQKILLVAYASW